MPRRKRSKRRKDSSNWRWLPQESNRAKRSFERAKQRHEEYMKEILMDLQNKFKKNKKRRKEIFKEWGIECSKRQFHDLGKVAYSTPPYFLKPHQKTESDARGNNADRQVTHAFQLLNEKLEREHSKTMFIIIDCMYENMFKWLESCPQKKEWEDFEKTIPDVICESSRYYTRPEDTGVMRHGSDLIIVHETKGVIFVQVKAVATHDPKTEKEKRVEKVEEALKQLEGDEAVFKKVMNHSRNLPTCHFVLALPNIEEEDFNDLQNGVEHKEGRKPLSQVTLLLKKDLFDYDLEKAERDYDLTGFQTWWNKLRDSTPMNLDVIHDILARYIGGISTPRDYKEITDVRHVRTLCEAIQLTGRLLKRVPDSQIESFSPKWVHIKGPPGSGRTTELIQKAEMFLQNKAHHVVILDIYRGVEGRPIGDYIRHSFSSENLHHCQIDADHCHKIPKIKGLPTNPTHTLFLADEVLPQKYWKDLLDDLKTNNYAGCQLWCADGLVAQDLDAFLPNKESLSDVIRLPVSVQKILYHADWVPEGQKRERYKADAGTQALVPTNGPTSLSLRHENHGATPVIKCTRCAKELARLLKDKLKLIEARNPASAGPSSREDTGTYLPCSIVILYSIPQDHYTEKENYLEITKDKFEEYSETIADCPFTKCLKNDELPIQIINLKDHWLEQEKYWDKISVVSVDWFQGLERDVVIFLPGDSCSPRSSPRRKRLSPPKESVGVEQASSPGKIRKIETRSHAKHGQAPQPSTSLADPGQLASDTAGRKIPAPGVTKSKSTKTLTARDKSPSTRSPLSPSESKPGEDPQLDASMADYHWSVTDLQRYSDWDKTNLVFAATRCMAQLILLVP